MSNGTAVFSIFLIGIDVKGKKPFGLNPKTKLPVIPMGSIK